MLRLRKIAGAGLGAAAALCMISGSAMAVSPNPGLTATGTQYATQAIASTTSVTFPANPIFVSNQNTTAGVALFKGLPNITLALPSPAIYVTTPTPQCSILFGGAAGGALDTCIISSNVTGVGTGTITVGINYNNGTTACTVAAPCTVQVNFGASFSASGVGALGTPTVTALKLTAGTSDPNFPTSSALTTAGFAVSASALSAVAAVPASSIGSLKIDVGTTALGKQFIQAGADSTSGNLGTITFTVNNGVDATGATQFSFGAFPANVTLSGNFTNIASAYIAPATTTPTTTCATTAPSGSFLGTVSGSTITFSNVTLPTSVGSGPSQAVCLIASGNGIIGQNVTGLVPTVTVATASPTTISGTSTPAIGSLNSDPYNGTLFPILYSGNFAAFPMFVRVTNTGGSALTVTAVVQPDTGVAGVGTVVTNLAAGTNTVVPVSTVITNSGVTLDSTGRVSISLLSTSTTIGMEQLLMNPGSVLVDFN